MAKKKMSKADVFFITDDEIEEVKKEVAQVSSGLICPKRNKSLGGKCSVCDYIQTQIYAKKFDMKHPAMTWAREKKAKLAWFLNVVFPENPDKAILFEVGAQAGNQIVSGVDKLGWRDIVHPHADVGRELRCSKTKESGDTWPTYTVSPALDKADWEIPEKVWKNVPDLNTIIDILTSEEMSDDNYQHVRRTIKTGETITFRVCPPQSTVTEGNKRRFIASVFRHWGVTEGQISGEDPLNWKETMEDEEKESIPTIDSEDTGKLDLSYESEETKAPTKKTKEVPNCYGMNKFFEADDEKTCIPCDFFKACGKIAGGA